MPLTAAKTSHEVSEPRTAADSGEGAPLAAGAEESFARLCSVRCEPGSRCTGLGTLAHEAEALRDQLAKHRGAIAPGASSLTDAELRMLPLLPTYLPFGEIAAELFLSTHTIKTQARSIYRKLGASTRSQAVAHARELGLLDG